MQDQDPQAPTRQPQPDPSRSSRDADERSGEDRHLTTAEMMIGTAMMFIGFIDVLTSISSGSEMGGVFPLLLYFAGLAIWAHATIVNLTVRYTVITMAIVLGLAFFHYGEVHFWHKQAIFWSTVAIVMYFMFKTSTK
ncbi:MAG: hypothetical protein E6K69_02830 [Nitrospirae bacterium]|nr:MAG: hypothetical protein E6K69_02830 [Nitrospirota bacterium]